jgi:hypothetical protein
LEESSSSSEQPAGWSITAASVTSNTHNYNSNVDDRDDIVLSVTWTKPANTAATLVGYLWDADNNDAFIRTYDFPLQAGPNGDTSSVTMNTSHTPIGQPWGSGEYHRCHGYKISFVLFDGDLRPVSGTLRNVTGTVNHATNLGANNRNDCLWDVSPAPAGQNYTITHQTTPGGDTVNDRLFTRGDVTKPKGHQAYVREWLAEGVALPTMESQWHNMNLNNNNYSFILERNERGNRGMAPWFNMNRGGNYLIFPNLGAVRHNFNGYRREARLYRVRGVPDNAPNRPANDLTDQSMDFTQDPVILHPGG